MTTYDMHSESAKAVDTMTRTMHPATGSSSSSCDGDVKTESRLRSAIMEMTCSMQLKNPNAASSSSTSQGLLKWLCWVNIATNPMGIWRDTD